MMQACSYFHRQYRENQRACRDIDWASHVFPLCSQSSDLSQQNTTFTWFVEAKLFNCIVKMMQAGSYFHRQYKENQRACRDIDRASHVFPLCSQSSDLSQQNTIFTWFVDAKLFNCIVKMMQACSYFHRQYRENQRACRDIDRASHVFPLCSLSSDLSRQNTIFT